MAAATHSTARKTAKPTSRNLVAKDDITVRRFRYLLDSVHDVTGVDSETIADKVVWANGDLRNKYGKNVNVLEIMEALNTLRGPLTFQRGPKNLVAVLSLLIVPVGTGDELNSTAVTMNRLYSAGMLQQYLRKLTE
jgi:hypothetical protein